MVSESRQNPYVAPSVSGTQLRNPCCTHAETVCRGQKHGQLNMKTPFFMQRTWARIFCARMDFSCVSLPSYQGRRIFKNGPDAARMCVRCTPCSSILCFRSTVFYISRTHWNEYCVVRRHKIGGPAQWWKIPKFPRYQLPVHLSDFWSACHTLQRNDSPHDKEHLLHTWTGNKSDIEWLFCRGNENYTILWLKFFVRGQSHFKLVLQYFCTACCVL